jgi:hypothetical protein
MPMMGSGSRRLGPLRLGLGIAAGVWTACATPPFEDRRPELIWPTLYAGDGISFSHPRNWRVWYEGPLPRSEGARAVQVVSVGATGVTIAEYRGDERPGLETVLDSIDASRFGEEAVTADILGAPRHGVTFQYVTHAEVGEVATRASVYEVEFEDRVLFLALRASVEDWPNMLRGFDAIRTSLAIDGLPPVAAPPPDRFP